MSKVLLKNSREIGDFYKPYFVAELNSSHFGDLETAKKMIDEAKASGCDCVKFQSWSAETLYSDSYYKKNPIARRMVDKFSLSNDDLKLLSKYCNKEQIDFASTPYSIEEAQFLVSECNVPFLKIASMELNNLPYLSLLAKLKAPLILSTGMGSMEEIIAAVDTIVSSGNNNLVILHCTAVYPSETDIIRLKNILGLRLQFPNFPIGYSDHSEGIEIPTAATALGACLIEKHFTLDSSRIGLDNQMATEPKEIQEMVNSCLKVHYALGGIDRVISDIEKAQIPKMRRSLVAKTKIHSGQIIDNEKVEFKRPGDGIPPSEANNIFGKKLNKDLDIGDQIQLSDLDFEGQ